MDRAQPSLFFILPASSRSILLASVHTSAAFPVGSAHLSTDIGQIAPASWQAARAMLSIRGTARLSWAVCMGPGLRPLEVERGRGGAPRPGWAGAEPSCQISDPLALTKI